MYIGQKVKYVGPILNDTFDRNTTYTVTKTGITDCKCRTPYVALKEFTGFETTCGQCNPHTFKGAYFDANIFKPIYNLNNIRIL